jgi:hypothetical protein
MSQVIPLGSSGQVIPLGAREARFPVLHVRTHVIQRARAPSRITCVKWSRWEHAGQVVPLGARARLRFCENPAWGYALTCSLSEQVR